MLSKQFLSFPQSDLFVHQLNCVDSNITIKSNDKSTIDYFKASFYPDGTNSVYESKNSNSPGNNLVIDNYLIDSEGFQKIIDFLDNYDSNMGVFHPFFNSGKCTRLK